MNTQDRYRFLFELRNQEVFFEDKVLFTLFELSIFVLAIFFGGLFLDFLRNNPEVFLK
jgi:hypothetical protein